MGTVNLEKQVFTTFEVAKLCNANITSIKNWIEDGKIRAFRTPGGHYRIQRAVLRDFFNRYGMPNPFDERVEKHVLILCEDAATVELVRRSVGRSHQVEGTDDPLEAALLLGEQRPECFVLDLKLPGLDGMAFVKTIRSNHNFNQVRIVAYTDTDDVELEHTALANQQVNYFVRQSEGIETLNDRVKQALV